MCGLETPWIGQAMAQAPGRRSFCRNISSNSSAVNNFDAEAVLAEQHQQGIEVLQLQDAWPSSVLSPAVNSSNVLQPCFLDVEQLNQPTQLLLGTSAGLFLVDLQAQSLQLLGLQNAPVGHVCYNAGMVLACSPMLDDTNQTIKEQQDAAALAGLYCLKLGGSSTPACSNSSPFSDNSVPITKLWHGNARCSAVAGSPAAPRIYLGTQPADMLYSDDLGMSWSSTGLEQAPTSGNWYRRLPPYEPSVRSISISNGVNSSSRSSSSSISATGGELQVAQKLQEQQHVLVGVEVGGAFVHGPSSPTAADASCKASIWTDCSQGLCKDIQALQQDPFSANKLYAVAGSGSMPGGLYRSRAKGQKWKRVFGYRYSVSVAISSYEKGRLLLVSADKPPEIGCNLFESVDGGRHWANVTDYIADAVNNLTDFAQGILEHAPVAIFVPGGLVLGCCTGHVLLGQPQAGGGYSNWQLLAKLPTAVHCMCVTDSNVAPVAVQRA